MTISLTASAPNASAHSAIAAFDQILLRHSAGVRSVLRIQSRVTARNGMKKAPITPYARISATGFPRNSITIGGNVSHRM